MKYLVLSCETSGLNLENSRNPVHGGDDDYTVISAGLIVVDDELNKIDELYVEIDYTDIPHVRWDKEALQINGFSIEKLKENGIPFYEAIEEIGSFILNHFDTRAITVIGHNTSSFTLPFFEAMFKRVDIDLNFSSHVYDLSTLGFVLLGANKKKDIYNLLNIKVGTRNALVDARNILRSLTTIRKM